MKTGEQIKKLRTDAGISVRELADKIGVDKNSISNWENNKAQPGSKSINAIADFFKVSRGFLFGEDSRMPKRIEAELIELVPSEGESITKSPSGNEFIKINDGNFLMMFPMVEEKASAGYGLNWSDSEYIETLPKHSIIVDKEHKGVYRGFRVQGDSMDDGTRDSIPDGSIVTGRSVEKSYWTSKLHLHRRRFYVIVHKEEGVLIKQITNHDTESGAITCHSLNRTYPDFNLNLDDCYELYSVVRKESNLSD